MSGYDPIKMGCLCNDCPLQGKRVVPPTGNYEADVVIVGEAPGYMEEQKGMPFVGPAGAELNSILDRVGLSRERIFTSYALLCRPEVPNLTGAKQYDFPTYLAWIRKENAIRKKAAKAAKITPELLSNPLDCCAPRLTRELMWFDGQARKRGRPNGVVVVPVGNFAALSVVGKSGITKLRGSPIPLEVPGLPILPSEEGDTVDEDGNVEVGADSP